MLIDSLLDNDLYKFTMMQFAFCYFPNCEVEYQLFYRGNQKTVLRENILEELREEIENIIALRFKKKEIKFLKALGYFSENFLKYLECFSLQKNAVNLEKEDGLKVVVRGKWPEIILWEVILLAVISELNSIGLASEQGEKNLQEKVDYLKKQKLRISFMEFGTRRRFSQAWQRRLNICLKQELPDHFIGTSNVKLAMDFDLRCYGTMGHELLQAGQRIFPQLESFQSKILNAWFEAYREPLSIALTDVLSTSSFLYDFKGPLARKYVGLRVDSGNPFEIGDKIISFYKEEGIDPLSKTLVFSDSINFIKAIELTAYFQNKIRVVFGIGTYLTHDHGISPPNLVIKMTAFNNQAVGKLTDTPEKGFCLDPLFLKRLQNLDKIKKQALKRDRDNQLMERAILKIRERFGFSVTFKDLMERATLRNLAKFVEGDLQFLDISKNLRKEDLAFKATWSPPALGKLILSIAEQPKHQESLKRCPSNILITGATGFLGSHILCDLYNCMDGNIYVLIRANNKAEARLNLRNSFQRYELPDLSQKKRIIPILGDLTRKNLGIVGNGFENLSNRIDAIYHIGSFVHHIYDYQTLRATNVKGTQELIRLAMMSKQKQFFYVSSIVAALERDELGQIKEDFPKEDDCDGEVDGYSQTKWVCEKLLAEASQQGLPVCIFRPSNIMGRKKDGVCSPDKDHILNLIKGCIQMGLAPNWDMNLNFVPVDFVSRFIIKNSSLASRGVFHVINRNPLSWLQLINWLNNYGYKIEVISEDQWCEKHLPMLTSENALFPLLGLYANGKDSPNLCAWASQSSQGVEKYQKRTTKDALCEEAPPVDDQLLSIYFDYLCRYGYLPKRAAVI